MAGSGRRAVSAIGIAVIIAAIIAIILVIVLIITLLRPNSSTPNGLGPSSTPPPTSTAPRPSSQPADCPDVQVISVPGTWESSVTDDPYNPTSHPSSLMLKVSKPLQQAFASGRADVWTTPYVAQFHNPIAVPPDGQVTYEVSRKQGTDRTEQKITQVYGRCKLTNFVLMGFSQGATIVGNIAADIGAGKGPIPAENVIGVGMIADPRRDPTQQRDIGPNPPGLGSEALLGGFNFAGISLEGKRQGGFGSVTGKTVSICAPGDLICDTPPGAFNPANIAGTISDLAGAAQKPLHGLYATTTGWQLNGASATVWLLGWARGLIDNAPTPPHS